MSERANERSGARELSGQCGTSEQVSGASERASGGANGPVLTYRFQEFLNHCVLRGSQRVGDEIRRKGMHTVCTREPLLSKIKYFIEIFSFFPRDSFFPPEVFSCLALYPPLSLCMYTSWKKNHSRHHGIMASDIASCLFHRSALASQWQIFLPPRLTLARHRIF